MRLLSLVRHAESSWDYPELSDFERPLNKRGRHYAPVMAQRICQHPPKPDRLVSSPALRAITTARLFAQALGISAGEIQVQTQIYEASVDTLLHLVRTLDDGDRHVMLFGHNPGLSRFAHLLAPCDFDELPTCAVARFELQGKCWTDAGPGCGKLVHYSCPRQKTA